MIHSNEAEQAVLGSCMQDARRLDDVADIITTQDFYTEQHRQIFTAMLATNEKGKPIDPVSLAEAMGDSLEQAGGLSYLAHTYDNTVAANAKGYAKIIKEKSVERRLMAAGVDIQNLAQERNVSTDEKMDKAQSLLMDLSEVKTNGLQKYSETLPDWVDKLDKRCQNGGGLTGISTGFSDLDRRTNGLEPGLIIIAGRPSMGKSVMAFNIANTAASNNHPTALFSLEMPTEQIHDRLHSSIGGIPMDMIRSGKLDDRDWPKMTKAMAQMKDVPLYIDETPSLTPYELRSRARRLKRTVGLGLIVVDYLQLMTSPGKENRTAEIGHISRELKSISKELHVPVVALSQLNRGLESRPNKRPKMSDLRESGAIEQDADIIMFVYRDEVYNEDSPDKGTAEIIIGKQRNGPIGTTRLAFQGEYQRFANLDDRH